MFNHSNTSYTPWATTPAEQYNALLQLLVIPHMACERSHLPDKTDQKAVKCTVRLHSVLGVLSPQQIQKLTFNPHLVGRHMEDRYSHKEIQQASIAQGGYMIDANVLFYTFFNRELDQIELYMSDKQAVYEHNTQDDHGLPIKVLYYSYQDLWQLDELVDDKRTQSWLDAYFNPACQIQLSTGQLPTQTPFPGSKGYVDLTINWLYSWLPNSKSQKTIHFNEQHWIGDQIIIGDLHDKIKRK